VRLPRRAAGRDRPRLEAAVDAAAVTAVQTVAKKGTDNAYGQGDGHPTVTVTIDSVTVG
jgi:hypothetical protein